MSGIGSRLCGRYLRRMELPTTPPCEPHDFHFLYILTCTIVYVVLHTYTIYTGPMQLTVLKHFPIYRYVTINEICCRQAFMYPRLINEWKCFSESLCCPRTFCMLVHSSVALIHIYCWYISLS